MTVFCQSDNTVVNRVRISPQFGDSAMQERAGRILRSAVLRSSALSPSAILIVRTLHGITVRNEWLNHSVYLPPEWEQAATRELDRLAAQAAHPALAAVPLAAQAVVFRDRAELLACMAQDWLQGALHNNWWWSALLKQGDTALALLREWHRSPEFLPVAFEVLAARSAVAEFLRRLPDDSAASLLEEMLRVFAVPKVDFAQVNRERDSQNAVDSTSPYFPVEQIGPPALHDPRSSAVAKTTPDLSARVLRQRTCADLPIEPGLPLVPEAFFPGLSPVKRILLVQALMLRRAPTIARSLVFQRQIAAWQRWAQGLPDVPAELGKLPSVSQEHAPQSFTSTMDEPTSPTRTATPAIEHGANLASSFSVIERFKQSVEGASAPETTAEHGAQSALTVEPSPEIETCFGGIFFLLNVALFLELYADFTSPGAPGLELNIWDFVCLLGLELAGGEIKKDPIWEVFASLAGREKWDRPGAYFDPPNEWSLPRAWLDPFPETVELKKATRDGRVQVIHPAGFILVDQQLEAATQPIDSLARWVTWIAGYVRARLVRALGRNDAAELLCRIPGRVVRTPTRLDVFYSLEAYPIEVRIAGLDRDPGWIPAAGHYVAYHFH